MFASLRAIKKPIRRFARARRGATAVEFSLVVFPFFLLLFGLAEIAMVGFAQTNLNNAVSQTARQIRTGQAQMGGLSAGQIHTRMCDELNKFMMMDCGGLYLDVNRFDSFTTAANNTTNPIQNRQFQDNGFGYSPGAASDIVVVRAYYRWKVMTPLFQPIFSNVQNGERIMVGTMMFRNEPF